MGNLVWEGVPLRGLLDSLELSPDANVRFLTANGKDVPAVAGGADLIRGICSALRSSTTRSSRCA